MSDKAARLLTGLAVLAVAVIAAAVSFTHIESLALAHGYTPGTARLLRVDDRQLLDQFFREEQALNMEKVRGRIAASIACHAAIKVNMPLQQNKMEWLLAELAKTECPMSCPHGRPVVLRYSMKDIQKAFKRI